ncbi:MAG: hypothetical protein HYV32_03005 [Candidatus Kerfeldbacteria bacterium]|nr:hypothetical protein [Candidatus Kerfeldbacteria bacterium]
MKIIILEGIATSGKTIINNLLIQYCREKNLTYAVIGEEETLMPILHNTDVDIAKQHLKKILEQYLQQHVDVLIFDRLYFTHVFRTQSSIHDFQDIEDLLREHDVHLYLFTIDEERISQRIFDAMKHREQAWQKYVESKGNREEIISYYTNQQRWLMEQVQQSSVPHTILNTTDMDFDYCMQKIVTSIL